MLDKGHTDVQARLANLEDLRTCSNLLGARLMLCGHDVVDGGWRLYTP